MRARDVTLRDVKEISRSDTSAVLQVFFTVSDNTGANLQELSLAWSVMANETKIDLYTFWMLLIFACILLQFLH